MKPSLPRALASVLAMFASLPAMTLSAPTAKEFVPCKIHQKVKVNFPLRPLHEGVTRGRAALYVEVDADGRLGDVLVFAHTGRDFADAAFEAVERWEYTPALIGGEPVRSLNRINVDFTVDGVIAYTKKTAEADERRDQDMRWEYRAFNLAELDGVPKAVSWTSPVYAREWLAGERVSVMLEYFIDEDGYTRFPRVVGEPDERLAAVTIEAVKTWRFQPPLRQGRPVLAAVRQEFHFRPQRS